MTILLLVLAIIFNASANILMKLGAKQMGSVSVGLDAVKAFVTSPYIWSGLVSFGLALMFYTYVLTKMNLSVAYPLMTSLGFLIVVSFSVFYLHETVNWMHLLGLVLVLAGLILITQR